MIKFWIACAVLSGTAWAEIHRCDRTCMTALTDQYLAALVKHDPAGLPLSKGVRFTENTAEIRIATACGWARRGSHHNIYAEIRILRCG